MTRTVYVESDTCNWHEADRCERHPDACVAGCLDDEQDSCGWDRVPATVDDLNIEAMRAWWDREFPCRCDDDGYTEYKRISPHCENHLPDSLLQEFGLAALGAVNES